MSYKWNLFKPLQKSDFTSVGSGHTLTDTKFGTNIVQSAGASAHSIAGMYISAPATPYTATTCMKLNGSLTHTNINGIGWSDGTKYTLFGVRIDSTSPGGTVKYNVANFTNSTTFSADAVSLFAMLMAGSHIWLRIADDNVNRTCSLSKDGINFYQVYSVARTTFQTPTRIGLFTDGYSSATNVTFVSWTTA